LGSADWRRRLCQVLILMLLLGGVGADDRTAPSDEPNPYAPGFYVDTASRSATAAADGVPPATVTAIRAVAARVTSRWLAGPRSEPMARAAREYARGAAGERRVGTLVLYNIPDRDCGGASGGGASSSASYREWVEAIARGLTTSGAASWVTVIVEPDALTQDCAAADLALREQLIRWVVFSMNGAGVRAVYVDAGHSGWVTPEVMARRLRTAGVGQARGWASNVSSFQPTGEELAYNEAIRQALGGAGHYIIDTSRNGALVTPEGWCNPLGAGLGAQPAIGTRNLDARLHVKTVGVSDGNTAACPAGSPPAGDWSLDLLLRLYRQRAPAR
jgi:endoglucanase